MDNPFVAQAELALLADNPRDALRIARMGLSLGGDDPALLQIAAESASQLDQNTDAAHYWQRLGELAPDDAQAWNGLGIALQRLGAVDEAEAAWRRALALLPDDANLHTNLGLLLEERGALAEAEQYQRRAVALAPDSAPILTNLGDLLAHRGRSDEARECYRAALARAPDFATAHCNLGVLLADQNDAVGAEAAFRHALALRPDFPQCRVNLAQLLLAQGRFDEGWPLHESRLARARQKGEVPASATRQWQGEPLQGRTIIVLPEQGYGDEIQFCRYVPWLKSLGASRVTLACRPELTSLMQTLAGADQVVDQDQGLALLEQHDYWTVLLSLPLHAGTRLDSIPAGQPYLHPDPQRVRRLAPLLDGASDDGALRIGLVWRGNPSHSNDEARSLPALDTLAPLWTVPGVRFFSLLKSRLPLPPIPPALPLVDLAPHLGDFADTAALLAGLDLLISVDTSVAHLAGALGCPCWVLLPARKTDWRWLKARTDSPWYPATRLFRQPQDSDWQAPVMALAAALAQLRGAWKT
ncbi:MAG: tetratricopeptide repeat protein [Proteobacteria bacterium]|nr:tetratricopeptide repeat protein [Pseudomonadota bacterium]